MILSDLSTKLLLIRFMGVISPLPGFLIKMQIIVAGASHPKETAVFLILVLILCVLESFQKSCC
jgi:hypothetical protein